MASADSGSWAGVMGTALASACGAGSGCAFCVAGVSAAAGRREHELAVTAKHSDTPARVMMRIRDDGRRVIVV
ncbi:MAG: hypothetical protein JXM71_08930 [Spirochaetales bacterium]|nr:hypothetical protein [Spirochaetales bacterium]